MKHFNSLPITNRVAKISLQTWVLITVLLALFYRDELLRWSATFAITFAFYAVGLSIVERNAQSLDREMAEADQAEQNVGSSEESPEH